MPDLTGVGKLFIVTGAIIVIVGVVLALLPKLPEGFGWFGKLPGDIFIKRDNFTFYFPLATSVLISVVVSLLVYFLSRR